MVWWIFSWREVPRWSHETYALPLKKEMSKLLNTSYFVIWYSYHGNKYNTNSKVCQVTCMSRAQVASRLRCTVVSLCGPWQIQQFYFTSKLWFLVLSSKGSSLVQMFCNGGVDFDITHLAIFMIPNLWSMHFHTWWARLSFTMIPIKYALTLDIYSFFWPVINFNYIPL